MTPLIESDTLSEMIAEIKKLNESPNIPWTYCSQPYDPAFNDILRASFKETGKETEKELEPLLPL
jgi:hypothetical protein